MTDSVKHRVGATPVAVNVVAVATKGPLEYSTVADVKRQQRLKRTVSTDVSPALVGLHQLEGGDVRSNEVGVGLLEGYDTLNNFISFLISFPGLTTAFSFSRNVEGEGNAVHGPIGNHVDEPFDAWRVLL
ncbi:MAG: hypothetical protein QF638_00755, partial [Acidimicrobiales bacterium]|nr:hypothetical protein [Acidimicrobiales bacterium]